MSEMEKLVEAIQKGNLTLVESILDANPSLAAQCDSSGATPLHHAAFYGHRAIVHLLIEKGANINAHDTQFHATPTGWAIEYLRELGGYTATELDDLTHAIQQADIHWTQRFLERFPKLREGKNKEGKSFRDIALQTGNQSLIDLFT